MFTSGCRPWLKSVACLNKLPIITEKTTKLTFHELNESNFQRNIVAGSVGRLVSIFSLTEEVTAGNISLMRRDHGDNFKVVRKKKDLAKTNKH